MNSDDDSMIASSAHLIQCVRVEIVVEQRLGPDSDKVRRECVHTVDAESREPGCAIEALIATVGAGRTGCNRGQMRDVAIVQRCYFALVQHPPVTVTRGLGSV